MHVTSRLSTRIFDVSPAVIASSGQFDKAPTWGRPFEGRKKGAVIVMQGGEQSKFEINLLGPFCILGPDGLDRTPKSKRACALLALLALSPRKTRTRVWLRDKLWSDRSEDQAAASLRQCIHQIKVALDGTALGIFDADKERVWLDPDRLVLDIQASSLNHQTQEQLLEGMDIRDPEFEEWLTFERQIWEQKCSVANAPKADLQALPATTSSIGQISDAPTIAILPFEIHGAGLQPYEAQGLADDLIIALSKNRWLKVISRSSTFAVDRQDQAQPSARDFGADYLLNGSLVPAQAEEKIQIKLRLEGHQSGAVIWSDQILISASEIHDVQRQIAERLLIRLINELGRQE